MKTKYLWSAMALALFVSCSDSKSDDPIPDDELNEDPTSNDDPKDGTVYTPEQSKTFLQKTATDFLDNFKPEDQKEAMELASYFAERFDGYDMPVEFSDYFDEDEYDYPSYYIKAVGKAARGNMDALASAAYTYTYQANFSDFTGIYEPNSWSERWERTGDSDKIIFRYYGADSNLVELTISQEGGYSVIDETIEDDWENTHILLSIPHTINATLTSGNKTIATSKLVSSIDVKGHTFSAEETSTLANVSVKETLKGTDTTVSSESQYLVNGNKVASKKAVIHGQNLCDKEHYLEGKSIRFDKIEAEADILGKVQLFSSLTNYPKIEDDMDGYWDYWDYDGDKTAAKADAQEACDRLSRNFQAYICYNGSSIKQASIVPKVGYAEWGSDEWLRWEYYLDAVLSFPDDTTYTFEKYFESFTSVTNKAESVIEAYERMWRNIR